MGRIRILYVITDLEVGGVPLHLFRLARAMRDQDMPPRVVCLSPAGPVSEMLDREGIETAALGARGPWDWRAFERLSRMFTDERPDLVHSFLFHANIASRVACALGGIPAARLICEIQTAEVERSWHLVVDRWTQRGCRFLVGNSPSVVEHLRRAARIAPARLRLVRGGIDPQPILQAAPLPRDQLGIDNPHPILLWVGRLDPVKGLDELIEAFAMLRPNIACNLVLVGDGAYRPRVEQAIRDSRWADSIRLTGPRSDVPRLLRMADLFVFPSRTEGMPNALLEAMAAGLPCVATDVPGCRDVIAHGVDGILVPARDPTALARAVESVCRSRATGLRLGASAARKVARDFTLAETHRSYRLLYDEAVAPGPITSWTDRTTCVGFFP